MAFVEGVFASLLASLIYDAAKMGGRIFVGKYGVKFNIARKAALKLLYEKFNRQQIESAFFSYSNLKAILFFDKKNINKFLLLLKQGTILEQDEYYIICGSHEKR